MFCLSYLLNLVRRKKYDSSCIYSQGSTNYPHMRDFHGFLCVGLQPQTVINSRMAFNSRLIPQHRFALASAKLWGFFMGEVQHFGKYTYSSCCFNSTRKDWVLSEAKLMLSLI